MAKNTASVTPLISNTKIMSGADVLNLMARIDATIDPTHVYPLHIVETGIETGDVKHAGAGLIHILKSRNIVPEDWAPFNPDLLAQQLAGSEPFKAVSITTASRDRIKTIIS